MRKVVSNQRLVIQRSESHEIEFEDIEGLFLPCSMKRIHLPPSPVQSTVAMEMASWRLIMMMIFICLTQCCQRLQMQFTSIRVTGTVPQVRKVNSFVIH